MINLNASINLKKVKVNVFALLKYSYPIVIIVIVACLAWMMYFLYQNVYRTLTAAEILTELRKKVPEETLQEDKFKQIIIRIREKTGMEEATSTATTTPAIKNPFVPLE